MKQGNSSVACLGANLPVSTPLAKSLQTISQQNVAASLNSVSIEIASNQLNGEEWRAHEGQKQKNGIVLMIGNMLDGFEQSEKGTHVYDENSEVIS